MFGSNETKEPKHDSQNMLSNICLREENLNLSGVRWHAYSDTGCGYTMWCNNETVQVLPHNFIFFFLVTVVK